MGILASLLLAAGPLFLVTSPLLSYADQIVSIRKNRSSEGFSLDIPLIMITASLLKICYYPGALYDKALLVQAFVMLAIQLVLLTQALAFMSPRAFHLSDDRGTASSRPWNFWQWRRKRPYWEFLALYALILLTAHTFFRRSPHFSTYTMIIGYTGLAIEACLPIPQLLLNYRTRSCQGFRVSVLANWLVGDILKLGFFYVSGDTKVPLAFQLCAAFQAICDLGLGIQYCAFKD